VLNFGKIKYKSIVNQSRICLLLNEMTNIKTTLPSYKLGSYYLAASIDKAA
jgi:hypothetical protein